MKPELYGHRPFPEVAALSSRQLPFPKKAMTKAQLCALHFNFIPPMQHLRLDEAIAIALARQAEPVPVNSPPNIPESSVKRGSGNKPAP